MYLYLCLHTIVGHNDVYLKFAEVPQVMRAFVDGTAGPSSVFLTRGTGASGALSSNKTPELSALL